MTSVSLSDTFAIKGTQETITITISRQEDHDNVPLKSQTPSRRSSNTSNASSRSSTFNIHYIPFLGEDDIASSGFSTDPGISDNDLSPATSFNGSHEDIFSKALTSDTDEPTDFIENDIPKSSQPKSYHKKNDGACSPHTKSRVSVRVYICLFVYFKNQELYAFVLSFLFVFMLYFFSGKLYVG